MKFRQKIFLITFIFETISIIIIGITIINNNYNKLIDSRIESNKGNIHNIASILKFYSADELNSSLFNKDNTYYEISKDDNIIYTNLSIEKNDIEEIIKPSSSQIKATIFNKMLFMSAKENEYDIILVEDISDIFENRQDQIYYFVRISMITSFIMAFGLYLVIFLLTRRIDELDKAVNKIEKGDYSIRVKKLGNDEIGDFGKSFNKMVNSIDEKITEIQKVSENRKNFIHNITHEIRTPLTSIIGYSSLIKNGKIKDSKTIIDYNNKIYEEGNYLNLISQRLIDIVLLDGKNLNLENIDISQCLNKAINNIIDTYTDITFIKNIEKNIIVKSDEILLHSLFTNILKNAAIACENKINKIIEISLKIDLNDEIYLIIKDNGKGMTEEQLDKVLEPFYTLNKDRNRKTSGMGLGLPLCVKICEVLNGDIKITSKLGEGTIVTIKFKRNG